MAEKREPVVIEGVEYTFVSECPCGQPVYANTGEEAPGLIHLSPMCEMFDKLEVDEFAKWLRIQKIGMHVDPSGLGSDN